MWIWTIIFAVTIFGLNISSTRIFAESEFWLALVKVVTVIAFIVLGLLAIFWFNSIPWCANCSTL